MIIVLFLSLENIFNGIDVFQSIKVDEVIDELALGPSKF